VLGGERKRPAVSLGSGYLEPSEWDPATKKYSRLDQDLVGALDGYSGTPYGCWDSVQGRVLFHLASKLFAYYPGRPLGQRIVQVNPTSEPFINTSFVTMFMTRSGSVQSLSVGRARPTARIPA
jgi:hypothetical protein